MAARTWTAEQRQRQAEVIQQWKPWERSTGPRSDEGKAKVSINAYKGGKWRTLRAAIKSLNQALRQQNDWRG